MKIIRLSAENIKRLSAVDISPEGNLVEITGKNGQGKTSVLDAIWFALGGDKTTQTQTKPVRDGQESGSITLDLGDYKVVRKFKVKEDGTITKSLTVTNKDGFKASSPQEVINSFLGDLTFDPLGFARMKPADQVVALRALVPDFDFDDAEAKNKTDFADRTNVNRTAKELRTKIDAIQLPDDAPTEPVSAESLMRELQEAMETNSASDAADQKRLRLDDRIAQMESSIEQQKATIVRHEKAIAEARETIKGAEQAIEELRDEIDGLKSGPERVDVTPIKERIATSEHINRLVNLRKQREGMEEELKAAEEKSAALTKAMDDRKAAAEAAVRAADLPVDGLALTEDGVLLNGVPFQQASDAEQLRVSIAVAGAMNPKLRVIRVRDGSLLDGDSMAALSAYAEQHDLQVWIETVDSGRESAVVIEDGHVAGAATLEAAE